MDGFHLRGAVVLWFPSIAYLTSPVMLPSIDDIPRVVHSAPGSNSTLMERADSSSICSAEIMDHHAIE